MAFIAMLAVTRAWTEWVHMCAQLEAAPIPMPLVYADDLQVLCFHEGVLVRTQLGLIVNGTENFCHLARMRISCGPQQDLPLERRSKKRKKLRDFKTDSGMTIPCMGSAVSVGAVLHFTDFRYSSFMVDRITKVVKVLRTVAAFPGTVHQKKTIIKMKAYPMLFGHEMSAISATQARRLRQAVALVLFGKKRTHRCASMLTHVLHDVDPLVHLVSEKVLAARSILQEHDSAQWATAVSYGDVFPKQGPAGLLRKALADLGWGIRPDGKVCHQGREVSLLTMNKSLVKTFVSRGFQLNPGDVHASKGVPITVTTASPLAQPAGEFEPPSGLSQVT